MDAVSVFIYGGAAWWAVVCWFRTVAFVACFLQPGIRRRRATRQDTPPISVVIPARRLEANFDRVLSSVFAQDYPQFELIVSTAEQSSPVIDMARQAAERHPAVPASLLTGNPQFTHNPKVSNLAPAVAAARHGLILVMDSNIELPPGQLRDMVANLVPGTGLVCAVPLATDPGCFTAEIERAMFNGHLAPMLLGASAFDIDVGFGKVMLFDRRDFQQVDGVEVMANTFGDDQALAKALRRIGLRTVFAASLVHQSLGARNPREVWERQLRWMLIRRAEGPAIFFIEPFFGMAGAAAAGIAAGAALGLSWWMLPLATVLGWLAIESAAVALKGWGWSWKYPLATLARELLIPVLWLRAWIARSVRWHGIRHDLPKRN
jgi:ceramide glucosyltransferase